MKLQAKEGHRESWKRVFCAGDLDRRNAGSQFGGRQKDERSGRRGEDNGDFSADSYRVCVRIAAEAMAKNIEAVTEGGHARG